MFKQRKFAAEGIKHIIIRVSAVLTAMIICAATFLSTASRVYKTTVYDGTDFITVITFSEDAEDVLTKSGVEFGQNDIVDLKNYAPGSEGSMITIYRAVEVLVYDGKSKTPIHTNAARNVQNALKNSGLTLEDGDSVNYDLSVDIYEGMEIRIARAFGVTVKADGKTTSCKVSTGTVADVLKKVGVKVDEDDIVNYKLTKKVAEKMKIVVKRVAYKTHKAKEVLEFEKVTVKDDSMYKDQSKITQKGQNGEKVVTYKDKYVDGELTETVAVKTKVTKKAVKQITTVGTKSRPIVSVGGRRVISELTPPSTLKLDENGRPTEYKRVITGSATAYYGGTITASGRRVKPGHVAVNPRQIPYGTGMYIVSCDGRFNYGYAIAADTGGFVYNGTGTVVDLYFWTYNECVQFGRRNVEIYIL